MIEPQKEIVIVAEKALRDLRNAAQETKNKELSATYVSYTASLALNKILELKQKVK